MAARSGFLTTSARCARRTPTIASDDFHLYQPASATRLHFPDQVDRKRPVGDNPPKGAILDYYLKAKPAAKEEITIEVFDAQGKRVAVSPTCRRTRTSSRPSGPTRNVPRTCCPPTPA